MSKRSSNLLLLASALLLALAPAAHGQLAIGVQPRLSWILPVGSVYELDRALGSSDDPWRREVSASTIGRSPAVSVAIELGDRRAGWLVRSGAARSVGSETVVRGTLDPSGPGIVAFGSPDPDEDFHFELPTTLTIGFAELVLPLLMGTERIRPYVSGGVSVKRYDFGPIDPVSCESVGPSCGAMDFTTPHGGTVVGAQVGVGAVVDAFGRSLELGLVDTFNHYSGRMKHDVGVFLGVSFEVAGRGGS